MDPVQENNTARSNIHLPQEVKRFPAAQPNISLFSTARSSMQSSQEFTTFPAARPLLQPTQEDRTFTTAGPGMHFPWEASQFPIPVLGIPPSRPPSPSLQGCSVSPAPRPFSPSHARFPAQLPSPSAFANTPPSVADGALRSPSARRDFVVMQGSHPPEEGLGLVANRALSQVSRLPQQYPQHQQQQQVQMAGRSPSANPHYNPQQFAAAASPAASPMMMAQQQQRPVGQMQQQQQQRPTGVAQQGSQIRGGTYLQQTQQFPQNQYVHHIGSVPMNNVNQARPGVQGGIAPASGTPHYGNIQNLGVAQQHNMQARQKPNQGPTVPSHYVGAMQQPNLGPGRQGVSLTAQQQHQQQQQQALQQQQLNAQQRLAPQQQQAMARQTQSQQMMQNQGNSMLVRGSSAGAQVQGISTGVQQQAMYAMGKPAQYQQQQPQQQPQQQQARPQMVNTSSATNQARPGTTGAAAQANNALPSPVPTTAANTEPHDATGSILGKRSIQDLLAQIDPGERLDPDVEEVLLEIADDFIENVTSFAVKLAKHRKSDVLEAKDVLLHLDKQWNITVPGFGGDEYRSFKKPSVSETHKQRLSVVRKSAAAGQAAAESKALSAAPATNASTPVKSGLSGLSTGPTGSPSGGSPGMPRLPRV